MCTDIENNTHGHGSCLEDSFVVVDGVDKLSCNKRVCGESIQRHIFGVCRWHFFNDVRDSFPSRFVAQLGSFSESVFSYDMAQYKY